MVKFSPIPFLWKLLLMKPADYERKDLWNRCVLCLEWKTEGVIDSESSKDMDCDEVMCAGWGESEGEWTEWGWQMEAGSWFHRLGHEKSSWQLVIWNEEDTGGRARVTTDEERVLHVHWTVIQIV